MDSHNCVKGLRRLAALLAFFASLFSPQRAAAQFTFASDNADNYGGAGEPGWTNSSDAGFGWGGWNFQNTAAPGGNSGQFLGSSSAQGFGNINNTTQSFAMYGNPAGANTGKVGRTLDFSLEDGDVFSIDMAVAFRNGNKGIDLFAGATKLWNFNVGGDQYQANGANLGWAYSQSSIFNLKVTQNSATSITINLTRGSDVFSTNLTVSGRFNGADLYVSGTDAGNDLNNFFFNTLLVTNSGLYNVAATQTESRFLTGSGNLAKTGNGTLTISGTTNNFTGTVGITNGAVRATASSALGSASSVTVQSGASLEYSGGITVARNLTINGTGISTGGSLRNISGNNTHSGNLTLGSASRIASDADTLTISGAVSGSGLGLTVGGAGNTAIQSAIGIGSGLLTKEGAGTLTVSGANAYTGGTLISAGRVVGDTRSLQGGITNNAALTFDQSTNGTYSGALSGTGSVVKTNSGAVTFSGANSYSGGTLVAGGTLIGDTRSLQGAITNTAAVTFSQTTNGSYTGLMSGTGGTLTKSGSGTVTFTANNTYTGATTVSGGRLIVNGSQTSSAVTVNNGASLGGSGTVGGLTVSGLVAPGNSIGTLSAGNTVFNGGGSFELEIFDWVNTAGTGWDLLAITGNLTLSNTSGSQFAINLVSLTNSSTPGLSTDWNPNVNFTNTFVTYTGSLLGTSFASSLFTVNTGSFSNTINGTFSITNVTGGLALLYTTAFAPPSSTYNWNAGSGLWGTAGNWTNGATPTNGASIIFSGAGGASTNSSTVSSVQGIVFANTAGAYTVSGTALAVGAGGISNASTSAQTISNNLSLSANAAITAEAGNIVLAGNLTNGGNAVTVGGAANTTISGVISGSGTLTKSGAGSLSLANANTYTGATTISGGTVVASENTSLGTTNAGTTVNSGATLELSGGITTAESITIVGSGVGDGGAIRSLGDGENTISGNITLGGNARINVDAPTGSVTTLASLGSANFAVSSEFSLIPYTQTSTNITLTSATAGDTLAGQFGSIYDWSSVSSFGLRMRVAGTNPDLPFEVIFYNGAFEELERYEASTVGLTSTASVKTLDLLGTSQPLSSVEWMEFKWNSSAATTSVSLFDVVSIPTSGLVVSGNVNAGTNVLTVGSVAAAADTVADGATFSGVISGAGGTYNGTATTLVKDGGGVLNLLGNNTFTGDVRILDGILRILFGSSTNSLGVGSDLFISSLGTLELSGDVSVSSFQGAGAGDAGNVALSSSAILTVNGANKTMTMAGNITGDGGLRLAGNASTVLTLTGNNTFIDNTAVVSGTLELAGTGGNQALASTGPVIVSSGAKLLLSTSNQVRDFAAVTLSGGTIQRGSGVSEVFGNLNIAGGSTLDFGLGAIGQLQFQSYSYTGSALVEVQNFLAGNRLQFLSSSFSSANLSQFDFNGIGYSTGIEGSYFTITAIPEPSTYLAAGGLIGLMLWSGRRRLASFALRRREDI